MFDFTLSEWHINEVWHVIELFRYMHLAIAVILLFTSIISEWFVEGLKDDQMNMANSALTSIFSRKASTVKPEEVQENKRKFVESKQCLMVWFQTLAILVCFIYMIALLYVCDIVTKVRDMIDL